MATIAPLLPPDPKRGEKWRDHRTVINGILWKLTTGVPWRDVPARYGPWPTLHSRLLRWQRDGTWARSCATSSSTPTRSAGSTGR